MARDEALLQNCSNATAQPVLRFYAWAPPTISLGYFQDYAEYEQLPSPAGDLSVVRRTTGGGAILHDLEITYALVVPPAHPLVKGSPNALYEHAHQALINAIGHGVRMLGTDNSAGDDATRRGPFFCFERRHGLDVVVEDADGPGGVSKLAGSAQRRTADAILQHGSIMLDSRYPQQRVATWCAIEAPIDFDQAAQRLVPAFEASLDVTFARDAWREEELRIAAQIEPRYAGEPWTLHRKR
jgi:lipoate-protein ligase A